MGDNLSMGELESVMERIVRNNLAIKEIEAENEALKGFFKGNPAFEAGTTVTSGKFYVKVSTNRRIDDALARRVLTGPQYSSVSKISVDPIKARRTLPETTLAKITKVYDNRIEIGLV